MMGRVQESYHHNQTQEAGFHITVPQAVCSDYRENLIVYSLTGFTAICTDVE